MIVDAERIAAHMMSPCHDLRDYLLVFYPHAPIPPMDHIVRTATPMIARVNGGIWQALCECGSKTDMERGKTAPGCIVWLSIPFGFCLRCLNRPWGGGWRRVTLPPLRVCARIEAVLNCRPNIGDQNWEPSETIDDLLRQNRGHDDPIPDLAVLELA